MAQVPVRYFAFTKRSIKGPFSPQDIARLPGFGRATLVCPEAALGQWREAHLEEPFQPLFDMPSLPPVKPQPPLTHEAADDKAVRSLLEKAILKNSQLENEVRGMKREYGQEKRHFEDDLKKKDAEIRTLTEKLKRTVQAAQSEHPSWEQLYKTLKKRADDKFFDAAEALSEKTEEVLRLKSQIQNMVDTYEDSKNELRDKKSKERDEASAELRNLRSELEEKDMALSTMTDNLQSVLRKSEEFQHIMLNERKESEEQNARFCEEIGKLKGELKWKQQELDQFKAELCEVRKKLVEAESADDLKYREQDEFYGVIQAKVKILSAYFDTLESRLKFAFKKA
jgi:chromosome segregation ATPase